MTIQDQIDGGWHLWIASPPPHGVLIQITKGTTEPFLFMRDEIPQEMNACGLYWRLTGVGRMQVESSYEVEAGYAGMPYWNFPSDYILPRKA